ncbi:S66 peptidase family protein [Nocardioides sp. MAHUQ-72]|uniref:S66 peptidase family protein n=1 Tax=unclassified Nocardioides TaxID=2615069 RepID=UPI003620BBD4
MTDHAPLRTELRRPPRLRRGDRVALLTPSSPATLDHFDEGVDVLRFCGLEPVEFPSARARGTVHPFLAGTDTERAESLRAALLDDSIAGVLTVCGGYGSQRMLEVLDWTGLDAVSPKVVVGYSDVTGLLESLASRLGWTSVMGPMVSGGEFRESYTFMSLWSCLASPECFGPLEFSEARTLVSGSAEGITAGGNLSLITGSIGTSTTWTPPGGIVLVEDEMEDPPRTDIMLTHLRRSGYFDRAAAVVAGTFTNSGDEEGIQAVIEDRLGDLGVPVITGANLGHGGHVQTWPIGIRARLDADARTVTFLEPPLV